MYVKIYCFLVFVCFKEYLPWAKEASTSKESYFLNITMSYVSISFSARFAHKS